jgi:glycyl-tRNA synthetase alpha chain
VENLRLNFERWEKEALRLAKMNYYLPAYDLAMRCSHNFNLLDARGAVSASERVDLIKRIRNISRACAAAYVKDNEPVQEHKSTRAQEHKSTGAQEHRSTSEEQIYDAGEG